ncbi:MULTISPECIES: DNA-3-methyladenine glycosylase I [Megasphaera]|uniref:DNA-3-methyladenine glycosylase I n=1 Tax=Megasphaera massiliensis TaxID=1232428 RepID=A0ABT1SNM3_9FIRM|nr:MULTISPECIES: DNA-3-methyladenine glycosylase I [Megasphaera]MCQ5261529.1 DNA-3-methyladenine glycosylase I [Megasphaera massiliensis]MCQ5312941.1 DNA-3-methyladenine glycosylase I [Megasphaera massiliensis]MCQ5321807.1 DNA-3-methyladenine glycosylase I [Megasphaera massiliensis]MCQ5332060.1 DNA-3-methyladenine glycosylase I [Megasphaera massiliensis]MCQ5341456.1 DNA-3-methyladenine glycosylase I [Megasphaera massiliensis]
MKKRGFKYVGPVTIYSHLQACGIINDHDAECPRRQKVIDEYPTVTKRKNEEVY